MLRLSRNSKKPIVAALLAALAAGGWAAAGPSDGGPGTVARARFLMGTRLSIEMPAPADEAAFDAAFAEVARLEEILSNWSGASEISRLNRAAASGPFLCSNDLLDAVGAALRWAEATDGAFDPTVEPLVRRLGLRGPEGRTVDAGADADGEAARRGSQEGGPPAPIGWRHVRLDLSAGSVRFDAGGVGLDLGGIGKGIALDAAGRILKGRGVRRALLDFGGQCLSIGAPPGRPGWAIGITGPGDRDRPVGFVLLRDGSLATSGNDERAVAGPAGRTGHILDPARGGAASFDGSLTVEAQDATTADALSTGLFVMGPERGTRWAEERGVAALFQWRGADGEEARRMTSAFARRMREATVEGNR